MRYLFIELWSRGEVWDRQCFPFRFSLSLVCEWPFLSIVSVLCMSIHGGGEGKLLSLPPSLRFRLSALNTLGPSLITESAQGQTGSYAGEIKRRKGGKRPKWNHLYVRLSGNKKMRFSKRDCGDIHHWWIIPHHLLRTSPSKGPSKRRTQLDMLHGHDTLMSESLWVCMDLPTPSCKSFPTHWYPDKK